MNRLFSALLWTVVFMLLLIGIDQLLVRVPASLPAHVAVATFYRDLRGRVIDLATGMKTTRNISAPKNATAPAQSKREPKSGTGSIEAVIGQRMNRSEDSLPAAETLPDKSAIGRLGSNDQTPRYVYADSQGELHFAGTLAEIPDEFRSKAKPLGE